MKPKRPGHVIALLVLLGLYVLICLSAGIFYYANHIVYDSSVRLSPQAFPLYPALLLGGGVLFAALFVLMLLRTKVGYWGTVALYCGDGLLRLLALDLVGLLRTALCLWLLFARPTRTYFRIGGAGREADAG